MVGLPENLMTLHGGEEEVRAASVDHIDRADDTARHIRMIEQSMDLIQALLHPADVKKEDDFAIRLLGIRLFNTLGATIKLLLSGYYQGGAAQLRDALETAFLLDFFTLDRSSIAVWRRSPDKERKKQFGPAAVRKALDKRDGLTTGKRGAAYDRFCKLASHPNPESAAMLIPAGSTMVRCGPYFDGTALDAIIAEAALTAVQGVQMFRLLIRASQLDHMEAKVRFLEAEAEWVEHYYGRKRDIKKILEVKALLALRRRAEAG